MKIPQMFYLRHNQGTNVFTYWNFHKTLSGIVIAKSRLAAKRVILAQHPEAEFYR